MSIIQDISGRRYGKLVAIKFAFTKKGPNGGWAHHWEFQCDCGNICIRKKGKVVEGGHKSCGCSQHLPKLTAEQSVLAPIYTAYKGRAKSLNVPFELTYEQLGSLVRANCRDCNTPPANKTNRSPIFYTGLCRLNLTQGFSIENCIPCCKVCERKHHQRRKSRKCTVENCDTANDAHGLCSKHKLRWQRTGDPNTLKHFHDRAKLFLESKSYCSNCKETKDIEQFHVNKTNPNGLSAICKPCQQIYAIGKYDLTEEDYRKLLELQQRKCAICGKEPSESEKRLSVDHNHSTGRVRGLLCEICNSGLGMFKDDIARLQRAISYLQADLDSEMH